MILVYCDHITPRHRFIFRFIFEEILGMNLQLTEDQDEFIVFNGPKINYSQADLPATILIRPAPLLSEKGISPQSELIEQCNNVTIEQFSFDPFAFSFYLVTRYEEYLPFQPDQHGRFPVEQSIAYRRNFLRIPLVNVIASRLKKKLEELTPGINFPCQAFNFLPSVDIDIAFAHLGKGWRRAMGAWAKILLKADLNEARERMRTLLNKQDDPYDNFGLHIKYAEKCNLPLLYFVLLGDLSRFDRNTSYRSSRFIRLLKELNIKAELGIHPSYRSHLNPVLYEKEKSRLEEIAGRDITRNRFHFLRLRFPDSFRLLISKGITDDYSLGYSTMNGFRASTCTPFYFYDLEREEVTDLKIHPFIFMDSAMTDQLKMNPAQAITEIRELLGQVMEYGGEAVGIWHNYSLSEIGVYKGWQHVFTTIFEQYQKPGL